MLDAFLLCLREYCNLHSQNAMYLCMHAQLYCIWRCQGLTDTVSLPCFSVAMCSGSGYARRAASPPLRPHPRCRPLQVKECAYFTSLLLPLLLLVLQPPVCHIIIQTANCLRFCPDHLPLTVFLLDTVDLCVLTVAMCGKQKQLWRLSRRADAIGRGGFGAIQRSLEHSVC